jgi:hypothetical protein
MQSVHVLQVRIGEVAARDLRPHSSKCPAMRRGSEAFQSSDAIP